MGSREHFEAELEWKQERARKLARNLITERVTGMANKMVKGKTVLVEVSSKQRTGGKIGCSKVRVALGKAKRIFEWIRDEESLTVTIGDKEKPVAAITTITKVTVRIGKMILEYPGGEFTDEQYDKLMELMKAFAVDGFYLKYSGFEVTPKQASKLIGMVQHKDEVEIVFEQNQGELALKDPESPDNTLFEVDKDGSQKQALTGKGASDAAVKDKKDQTDQTDQTDLGKPGKGKKESKAKKTAKKKKAAKKS